LGSKVIIYNFASMTKNDGKLVAVLGTVIIHLIAGILFMSFQISSLHNDSSEMFQVEIAPVEETEKKTKIIELPATTVERVLQGDDEMLNIARNLANKSDQKINPSDYIDKVKEELIKSGKLGIDNYIDEQKRKEANIEDKELAIENEDTLKYKKNNSEESQELASNYKGPTRIYYNLERRTHTYLPIPIYKCEGAGKVVISIMVNQKGVVEKAVIIENESTTSDPCLIETAVATALISRFNSDLNSPKLQNGTLSYHFVAQ
jgi:hypothetical protein